MAEKSLILLLCASAAVANICATENSDGVLFPAAQCNQYHLCSQGVALTLNCQADLVFNPLGFCDWPENVNCGDKNVPNEESKETPEEKPEVPEDVAASCAAEDSADLLVPAKDCAQFYKCSEGQAVLFSCPTGLLYNPAGMCDWPTNVNCDDRSIPASEENAKSEEAADKPDETPVTSEAPESPETPVDADAAKICAAERSDGKLVPHEDCSKFYKCSEGVAVVFDCQVGLLYNPAGWCDWPANVNCDDRSVPDDKEVEAKSEEAGEKPDETLATSEEAETPVSGNPAQICAADGSDGVLVPHEVCSKFYKCAEGLPVALDCQVGLLYNPGGWCDWPLNVDCGNRANIL